MNEPECRTYENGRMEWYLDGERHRTDGPAVICPNGFQQWYQNGLLHRTDGPAVIYASGYREWWIEGQQSTQQEVEVYRFRKWYLDGELA